MILLDTHVWLWWSDVPARLSAAARGAIARAGTILVSPLSCFEAVNAARRGRIVFDRPPSDWVRAALAAEGTRLVDLHPQAAILAGRLGADFPGDPIDRLLYATALHLDVPLVTADESLRRADPVRTLW